MKFDDYVNRPKVTGDPTKSRVISFVNETREQAYEEQIATLQEEIERLTAVEAEFLEKNAKFNNTEDRLHETIEEETQLRAKVSMLQNDLSRSEKLQEEKQELESLNKDLRGQFDEQNNQLQINSKDLEANKQTIHTLSSQVNGLKSENDSLTKESEANRQLSIDVRNEFEDYKISVSPELSEKSELLVKYHKEVGNSSELSQELSRVQGLLNKMMNEKNELEKTRKALEAWANAIESDNAEAQGINASNRSELQKTKAALTTLTKQVQDLISENTMIAETNAELIAELSRPKHMSMSTIERSEGFKLPRKMSFGSNHLGNSTPTLLKVQQEEA